MKSFSVSLILMLCVGFYASAQPCPVNSNPTTWDWRGSADYVLYLSGARYNPTKGVVRRKSPWYDTNTNENVAAFRFQTPKDYEPSGGWVLMQRDFGAPGRFINHPYFILYNKYTGIMRIFVAISETVTGYNKAIISLKYAKDNRRTAVLGFYSSTDYISPTKTFDNNVQEVIVGNSYAYDLPYWLHADFVMNYDPCTCNVSDPNLQFTVKLVSESTLTFKAEGNLTPKDNLGRKSDGKLGFTDFTGAVKSATDTYSNTEKAIKSVQSIAVGVGAAEKDKPWELLNFVPGLGFALGFVDALVGVFDKTKSNQTKPTAYKIDFTANGAFTTVNTQRDVFMNVPGSSITVIPPTNIQYRNALGVFTLIEKPTVIVTPVSSYNPCPSPYECRVYTTHLILDNFLRYAINPAIGTQSSLDEFKIQVRLEVDYSNGSTAGSTFQNYSCFGNPVGFKFQGTYQEASTAGLRDRVFVKVAVKYKKGTNEAVYMARYPAVLSSTDNTDRLKCPLISSSGSKTTMSELCGSSDYRNRSNQYLRTTDEPEKVIAGQNEQEETDFVVYPNPSLGILNFSYSVKETDNVHIYVTDLLGKKIADIVDSQCQDAGTHQGSFDLKQGQAFSPGMYLCRFRTPKGETTRKIIVQ